MTPRVKKLIGFALFLPALILYFFAAAALSEILPDNILLKSVYFLGAGIAWAWPAKFAIAWMNAEPAATQAATDKTPK